MSGKNALQNLEV